MVFGYRDHSCGTLFCSGGWEFPVTSSKSIHNVGNGGICNEATIKPEDNYPADLGKVPTGTKCGNNMVKKTDRVSVDIMNKNLHGQQICEWCQCPHSVFCVFQVCYNQRCQNIENIKVYGTNTCSAKCNNHGVKNTFTSQHFGAL